LAVELCVCALALGDDGAVDLHACIETARLNVAVHGLLDGLAEGTRTPPVVLVLVLALAPVVLELELFLFGHVLRLEVRVIG
jgi:hypothetical protein